MKYHSQALLLALGLSIAVVLALFVSLISISYMQSPMLPPTDDDTSPLTSAQESATQVFEPVTEAQSALPSPTLQYISNGDGTCKLVGIENATDACVSISPYSPTGEKVTEIADRAFYGCAALTAVQIPATVEKIGKLAFAACDNLMVIAVNQDNTAYCDIDGVLYSKDKQVLLQYPPMRAGSTVTINTQTKTIEEMAFYRCVYLSSVRYLGTAEEWEAIHIGQKNYSLTAASKVFLPS